MEGRQRAAALICCLFILVNMALSTLFIEHELGHDCSGDHCPTCQLMDRCAQDLKKLGGALAVLTVFALVLSFLRPVAFSPERTLSFSTPVTLKVKLTD